MKPFNPTTQAQLVGYWIEYFAERIQHVIHDEQLSWTEQQQWLDEMAEDLRALARDLLEVTDGNAKRARHLAHAMQSFIFHDGPDPDANPDFAAIYCPVAPNDEPISLTEFATETCSTARDHTHLPETFGNLATAYPRSEQVLISGLESAQHLDSPSKYRMDGPYKSVTTSLDFSIRMVFEVNECLSDTAWLISDGICDRSFLVTVTGEAPHSIRPGDRIVGTRSLHQVVDAANRLITTSTLSQILKYPAWCNPQLESTR